MAWGYVWQPTKVSLPPPSWKPRGCGEVSVLVPAASAHLTSISSDLSALHRAVSHTFLTPHCQAVFGSFLHVFPEVPWCSGLSSPI